jgi:hypothetical protein
VLFSGIDYNTLDSSENILSLFGRNAPTRTERGIKVYLKYLIFVLFATLMGQKLFTQISHILLLHQRPQAIAATVRREKLFYDA